MAKNDVLKKMITMGTVLSRKGICLRCLGSTD
jgi:hypothetical protein